MGVGIGTTWVSSWGHSVSLQMSISVNWEVCNTTSRNHCCRAVPKTNVLFSYKHESDEGLESLLLGRGGGQNALLTSCLFKVFFCCVASTTLDARGVWSAERPWYWHRESSDFNVKKEELLPKPQVVFSSCWGNTVFSRRTEFPAEGDCLFFKGMKLVQNYRLFKRHDNLKK